MHKKLAVNNALFPLSESMAVLESGKAVFLVTDMPGLTSPAKRVPKAQDFNPASVVESGGRSWWAELTTFLRYFGSIRWRSAKLAKFIR